MSSWRLVVAPMAALGLCLVAVLVAARHPVPRPPAPRPLTRRDAVRFVRYVLELAAGGYAALLAVVSIFHVLVVGERGALAEAATGGALLLAMALPVFALLTWAEGRLRGGG